jgi:hypothetical protein
VLRSLVLGVRFIIFFVKEIDRADHLSPASTIVHCGLFPKSSLAFTRYFLSRMSDSNSSHGKNICANSLGFYIG